MQLGGAVAVVTGAAGGIGAATARALSVRGATVVAVDRDPRVEQVAERAGWSALVVDVRDHDSGERIVTDTITRHGRVDVVVANAGVGAAGAFATMPVDRIDDVLAVNVRAPIQLARAALPTMLDRGGAVVFVSSIAGLLLVPRESVYSASKAAIEAFAEPLREELAGSGVTVSTVAPGVVATRFFDERGEPYERRFPRPQPPERIAAAIVAAVETGAPRIVVPRWFGVPIRLRGAAPGLYRALARRLG
jgi:short-subunit dehydrogenase